MGTVLDTTSKQTLKANEIVTDEMLDPFANNQVKGELEKNPEEIHALLGIMLGMLCLTAHVGINLHRAGITQRKNITSALIKPLVHFCLVPALYWLVGYGLFSDGNFFLGTSDFFLRNHRSMYEISKWFIQCCIVMKCVSIASCGGSEYNYVTTEALHCVIITGILFPFPAHWGWNSEGWLLKKGYIDYGGVGPIYLVAASSGLVLNLLSQKRLQYDHHPINPRYLDANSHNLPNNDASSQKRQLRSGGNVALATVGAIVNILGSVFVQIGMASFHGGRMQVTENAFIIIQNSIISTACGGITAASLSRIVTGQWSMYRLYRGMLSGIIICSGGGHLLKAWQCSLLGLFAGFTYILFRNMILYLGMVDTSDIFSTYGALGFMSIIITPVITMHSGLSSEWPMRLGWNTVGAISMMAWSLIITLLAFYTFYYFDLLGQTSLFLNGIDKHQMREQHSSDLENIEGRLCKCNEKSNAFGWGQGPNPAALTQGGDCKYTANDVNKEMLERFNSKDKRAALWSLATEGEIESVSSEKAKSQLQMPPNRHAISPPRLVSTTSNIPLIANLPMTESFERPQNANQSLPPRLNSSINLPMTSTMLLKEAPISERYKFPRLSQFPTPPPQPPIVNNGTTKASSANMQRHEEDSNLPNNNNKIEMKKVISRPKIQLVAGDDSDVPSLPRSPWWTHVVQKFEDTPRQDSNNQDSNKAIKQDSNKSHSELIESSKPRTNNQSLKRPDSLTHLAVQNQLKMLKPLPSGERRPSLSERRDVTPVGKK